jgi:site-specific DNA-methyltransferase (adenine-specific)
VSKDVADVLAGRARWGVVCSDAVAFLKGLPDDSIDLLFTSPPYERARTYGISSKMPAGQEWVDWMFAVVSAAAPKVRGLIAVNCEGQTKDYSYSGVPFLLFADLKRAGFNMRKPVAFQRNGIPGSGGPDWLRNDWEPVVCVTRDGQLPWSDNTACGQKTVPYPNRGLMTNRKADGRRDGRAFVDPEISNPGNVFFYGCAAHPGHDLAHENEAPFPLKLAEFFVKSFAPPDGIVCDPFSGSGTTMHAAFEHGRRFVGCDLRESQVELAKRRLATVTPSLFAAEVPT